MGKVGKGLTTRNMINGEEEARIIKNKLTIFFYLKILATIIHCNCASTSDYFPVIYFTFVPRNKISNSNTNGTF